MDRLKKFLFLILFVSYPVFGKTLTTAPAVYDSSYLLKMILNIFLFFLALGILYFVVKKFGLPKFNNGVIKMISACSLSAREKLVMIDVEGIRFLIGVSPGSLNLIHKFEGKKAEHDFETVIARELKQKAQHEE